MTDFEIAVQRLTALANNPKTPAAVAGDLSLVLLEITRIAALEAELAAVKEENAKLTKRLSSGVKFYTLSVGGASGIEICKIHAGWSVYITHYGNFGPKNERTGLFESLDAAWDALVVAGWLA